LAQAILARGGSKSAADILPAEQVAD